MSLLSSSFFPLSPCYPFLFCYLSASHLYSSLSPFSFFSTSSSDEITRKLRNQHPSCIPNFVCDPSGSVFCVDLELSSLVTLVSFIVAKDLKGSTTLQQTEPRQVHHRNFLHPRPIKQRHYPSKRWLIAIVLKQLLVVWDLWTYKSGF